MPVVTHQTSITLVTSEAIEEGELVKLDAAAASVSRCDAGETPLGVCPANTASGAPCDVDLLHQIGVVRMKAAAAVSAGQAVFAVADGEIDDDGSNDAVQVGTSLEAAAAGDLIKVLPVADEKTRVYSAGGSVTAGQLVKLAADGDVETCTASDVPIGKALNGASADEDVLVRMLNAGGVIDLTVDAAVTRGAVVYAQAAGKVDDDNTGSPERVGIADGTGATDGDVIPVILF